MFERPVVRHLREVQRRAEEERYRSSTEGVDWTKILNDIEECFARGATVIDLSTHELGNPTKLEPIVKILRNMGFYAWPLGSWIRVSLPPVWYKQGRFQVVGLAILAFSILGLGLGWQYVNGWPERWAYTGAGTAWIVITVFASLSAIFAPLMFINDDNW